MERFTKPSADGQGAHLIEPDRLSPAENGYAGAAAERLARLESLYEQLEVHQATLSRELETLRLAGKTRTTKFHQLMAKKLTDKNVIILLDTWVFDKHANAKDADAKNAAEL